MGLGVTQRHDWGWVRGGQAGIRDRAFGSRGLSTRGAGRLGGGAGQPSRATAQPGNAVAIEDVGGLERRQPAGAPGGRLASNVGNRGPSRSLPGRLTGSQTPLSLRKCRRCPTWGLVATGSAGSPSGSTEQLSSQASRLLLP